MSSRFQPARRFAASVVGALAITIAAHPGVARADACEIPGSACLVEFNIEGFGITGYTQLNQPSNSGVAAGVFGGDVGTNSGGPYNAGVYGLSMSMVGVEGVAQSGGYGVFGVGTNGAVGGNFYSDTGTALAALTGGGIAMNVENNSSSNSAAYITNYSGNGADVTGAYLGIYAHAPSYPLVLTDSNYNNVFFVDASGNVYQHGSTFNFAVASNGRQVAEFSSKSTTPTLEDTGVGRLVNGQATIQLDPVYAASIDMRNPYRVFITPGGDTHGLYVAAKTPNGFIVRESQGGRSTVAFDYRIVGDSAGQSGTRMAFTDTTHFPNPRAQTQRPQIRMPKLGVPPNMAKMKQNH